VAALAVGSALWLSWRQSSETFTRTFRIGYEHSPPDQVVAADGSPGGPAVEIVREAARRRGIQAEALFRAIRDQLSTAARAAR
jgi:hypothetical protein